MYAGLCRFPFMLAFYKHYLLKIKKQSIRNDLFYNNRKPEN